MRLIQGAHRLSIHEDFVEAVAGILYGFCCRCTIRLEGRGAGFRGLRFGEVEA